MVAKYYNCNVSKDYLERVSETIYDGTTMYGLREVLLSLGFDAYGKKGNVRDIPKLSLPVIAHIKIDDKKNLYHYVVITNITDKRVIIKDPSNLIKSLSIDEFNKISTGNYLFVKKTASIKRFVKVKTIKNEILKLITSNKNILVLMIISIILSISLELLNLFSLKIIINNALTVKSTYNLVVLLLIFLYLLVLKTFYAYFIQLITMKLTKKFSYQLKLNLTKQLLSLPNLYYQTKERGIIISLFNDIDTFADSLLSGVLTFINSIIILVFIYLFFLSLSNSLALILIISSIILLIFIYSQKRLSTRLLSKYYKVRDNYNSKLQQVVVNNDKIKGLHLEEVMFKRTRKVTDTLEDESYRVSRYSEVIRNILSLLEGAIYLLVLGVGGILLITTTKISLATFLLLEGFIFMGLKNVENLVLIILKYQNARKIKMRLDDIFNYEKELLLPFPNSNYLTKNMDITISNLYFKYRDNLVLNNINMKIMSGDKVFIYGDSGSGKSTLVKLLGRFLPLSFGNIKLGNIDLTHYNLADLRNIVTYVSNKEMFSNTNIKDNIYLSRKPYFNQNTLLSITGVKKLFNDKNYSLDTILLEDGENISMGERSRINLAQALFKPSYIYILDECLSNVDVALEREILKNIINYYQDKIIIYISHRLNNKDLFNRVFYLEKGKCHEEL